VVQGPREFPVGSSGGLQLLRSFVELAALVGKVLFEQGDPPSELVDVDRGPEPGLGPDTFTELGRQAFFQLPDPCDEALVGLQRVREISLQRGRLTAAIRPLSTGVLAATWTRSSKSGWR
jgi:hypothetical protein